MKGHEEESLRRDSGRDIGVWVCVSCCNSHTWRHLCVVPLASGTPVAILHHNLQAALCCQQTPSN